MLVVVSSVPVYPVMSMLEAIVAAARVVVPVGVELKNTRSVDEGVQPHAGPPELLDHSVGSDHTPPVPIR